METKRIKVMIADDTDIAREGLKAILVRSRDIDVVGEATTAQEAIRRVRELSPDVLLMDLKWRGDETAGWSAIREIKASHPGVKIIAITAYDNLITDARRAGADAALTKTFSREELLSMIKELVARPTDFPLPKTAIMIQDELSPRELDVLQLVEKGFTDREIAEKLSIAEATAKNHVKNILSKLDANNRTKAVSIARDRGLLN